MTVEKHWIVEIRLTEQSDEGAVRTQAEARLRGRRDADLRGLGLARKHPDDADVPRIGDDLAAARALSDLAHHLLHVAIDDIEQATHEQVTRLTG